MILREFLYVDVDKVRGLLAQLDDGIVEESTEQTHHEKTTGGGFKGLAEHSQRWGTDATSQKSMGDALFPTLEQSLESLGLLTDISDDAANSDLWGEQMRDRYPPGTLIRITAPAALFDARYVTSILTGFATTWQGLVDLGVMEKAAPPPLRKGQQGGQRSTKRPELIPIADRELEDNVPPVTITYGGSVIEREYMQGIVRVSRGMFSTGLHLNMLPSGSTDAIVTARLQEGQRFLDGDTEVLFARYGVSAQDWTMVGTIGHYGHEPLSDDDAPSLVNDDGSVNRAGFTGFINNFLHTVGGTGLADLPQEPGFSVVPLAVYRLVGDASKTLAVLDGAESP
ncbi:MULTISPECIES: hypothetical protein [unclassified Nocardioides]|uniref:DUF6414 family protein n=1 Tax=unclassified Nocardioides TaxID=2615069 RepID=UPI0007034C87|nr:MULTISPECIES: hypothetical protein [unclassified Nocardioides]KRC50307.1 hypothetical protein ASE19_17080 [Nocardioides sp. Root79]KRC75775.1 hypothetical protein ASE20_23100 [Nocardioides sp. Root240]